MKQKDYTFDFIIPQGPTGPTGPTGIQGLQAYGGRYNDATTSLNLNANIPEKIPLLNMMPPQRMHYQDDTKIIIENAGTYEISYKVIASTNKNTTLTIVVQENGIDINATKNLENLYIDEPLIFSTSTIYTLHDQTELELVITSKEEANILLGFNAVLIVKKLN